MLGEVPAHSRDSDLHLFFYWVAAPAFTRGMKLSLSPSTRQRVRRVSLFDSIQHIPDIRPAGVVHEKKFGDTKVGVQGDLYIPGCDKAIRLRVSAGPNDVEVLMIPFDRTKKGTRGFSFSGLRISNNPRKGRAFLKALSREIAALARR